MVKKLIILALFSLFCCSSPEGEPYRPAKIQVNYDKTFVVCIVNVIKPIDTTYNYFQESINQFELTEEYYAPENFHKLTIYGDKENNETSGILEIILYGNYGEIIAYATAEEGTTRAVLEYNFELYGK